LAPAPAHDGPTPATADEPAARAGAPAQVAAGAAISSTGNPDATAVAEPDPSAEALETDDGSVPTMGEAEAAADTASTSFAAEPTVPPAPTQPPVSASAGQQLGDGVRWLTTLQPDAQRPYAFAEVVDIDPRVLQIKVVPGTVEPRPTTGLVGSGVIAESDWPALVAAFNGGFAAMHGHFGLMVDRKVYLPARDGVATLAMYEDGSLRMGTWGKDLRQTPDMVAYRQNCPPLIENGIITAETGKLTLWGLSVSNEVYLYRSGLGLTADGRLVYVAGKPLSAYTLARALQQAGAQYAMQLDVDEFHVAFMTYQVQPAAGGGLPAVTADKLRADMRGFDNSFLKPFVLDFFYLVRRPSPLAEAVRATEPGAAAGAADTAAPASAGPGGLPGRIAFASDRAGTWNLNAIALDGAPAGTSVPVRQLTSGAGDDLYPGWAPDGRQVALASRRAGNSDIYILELGGDTGLEPGKIRQVTDLPSEEWAPAWSPDGARLAYQSDRNGQADIYVSAPDGSGEQRLTPQESNNEAPHWSPDGRSIIFDSDLDIAEAVHASISVYVMKADGSQPRRIVQYAESPAWSPDGNAIAYTVQWGGFWQVVAQNLDGTDLRWITPGGYNARYPTWSPDGRWLAFAADAGGRWDIYVAPAAGGQATRLTNGPGNSSYPAWGP
jgi:Tol biopolymer transport system component